MKCRQCPAEGPKPRYDDLIEREAVFQVIAANNLTDKMTLKCYDDLLEGVAAIPAIKRKEKAK